MLEKPWEKPTLIKTLLLLRCTSDHCISASSLQEMLKPIPCYRCVSVDIESYWNTCSYSEVNWSSGGGWDGQLCSAFKEHKIMVGQEWEPPLPRRSQVVHSSIWHSSDNRWRQSVSFNSNQTLFPSPPLVRDSWHKLQPVRVFPGWYQKKRPPEYSIWTQHPRSAEISSGAPGSRQLPPTLPSPSLPSHSSTN